MRVLVAYAWFCPVFLEFGVSAHFISVHPLRRLRAWTLRRTPRNGAMKKAHELALQLGSLLSSLLIAERGPATRGQIHEYTSQRHRISLGPSPAA